MKRIFAWLEIPDKKLVENLDDAATTRLHAEIINREKFLRRLYADFYTQFKRAVNNLDNKVIVELGSGGGFIKEVVPNVITSDIIELPNVDMAFNAVDMPFESTSVDAFFMIDILHHIADPQAFFNESLRCLKNSGRMVMIEPANTVWSRFVYKNFHHELFDTHAGWELQNPGRLSQANGALPWIIFSRDRKRFEKEFSSLKTASLRNHTPLRYLLSGGLTLRQLVPDFVYPLIKTGEFLFSPINNLVGMFQTIELEKLKAYR